MFCSKTIAVGMAFAVLGTSVLFSQAAVGTSASSTGLEFPVNMRQNIEAGKTPVGARVQAKLAVATLVSGTVMPEGAILSGEVIESVAKSASDASRLAIRMDSARWKNGSAPVALELAPKVYLTEWYYPSPQPTSDNASIRDASQGPPDNSAAGPIRMRKGGVYRAPTSQPSLSGNDEKQDNGSRSTSPESDITKHRLSMKDVESTRPDDGAVTLTSKHSNIKLDKSTTYVLAPGVLSPAK